MRPLVEAANLQSGDGQQGRQQPGQFAHKLPQGPERNEIGSTQTHEFQDRPKECAGEDGQMNERTRRPGPNRLSLLIREAVMTNEEALREPRTGIPDITPVIHFEDGPLGLPLPYNAGYPVLYQPVP